MKTFVTLKWGHKFSDDYVHRLRDGIAEHYDGAFNFVVYSDTPERFEGMATSLSLPERDLTGWWNKLSLFRGLPELGEQAVWMDLDTIIAGDIKFLDEYEGDLMLLRDFYSPEAYATGLMIFAPMKFKGIWTAFDLNREFYFDMWGDQQAVENILRQLAKPPDFFQDRWPGKIVSYKCHCLQGVPLDARIICFHGNPMPHAVNWLNVDMPNTK